MKDLYYVTVWCSAMDSYEVEAKNKEEAEKKALEIMYKHIPNAKDLLVKSESKTEMKERETLNGIERA